MKIGFFGLGKLGLDCAEVFAEKYEVYGYDIYPRTSSTVKVCAGPEEVVENSDWIFIAVQTPHAEGYDGSVPSSHKEPKDFGHDAVKTVLGYINKYAKVPKKIVLISTVLPGTCSRVFNPMLDSKHTLIYNPYLIAMGTVKWDMINPEMVIIGSNPPDSDDVKQLIELYRPLMENNPRYETGTWEEAESVKIFYNTYISAKVGIVNMIQDFAMRIGNIDVDVVTNALANSTIRLQSPKYMTAGMGDAGACVLPTFPVEVDGKTLTIQDLFDQWHSDLGSDEDTRLIVSANYACSSRDEKKINTVTSRDYSGDIIKITTVDGKILETTSDHLIPVMRNRKRLIVRANEILNTDKLYGV